MKLFPLLALVLLQSVPSLSDDLDNLCVETVDALKACGEKNECKAFIDDLLAPVGDDNVDDPTGTDDGALTCAGYIEELSTESCPQIVDQCSGCIEEASAVVECFGQFTYEFVASFAAGFGDLFENSTSTEEDDDLEECVVKLDCSAGSVSTTGVASFVAVVSALAFMMN